MGKRLRTYKRKINKVVRTMIRVVSCSGVNSTSVITVQDKPMPKEQKRRSRLKNLLKHRKSKTSTKSTVSGISTDSAASVPQVPSTSVDIVDAVIEARLVESSVDPPVIEVTQEPPIASDVIEITLEDVAAQSPAEEVVVDDTLAEDIVESIENEDVSEDQYVSNKTVEVVAEQEVSEELVEEQEVSEVVVEEQEVSDVVVEEQEVSEELVAEQEVSEELVEEQEVSEVVVEEQEVSDVVVEEQEVSEVVVEEQEVSEELVEEQEVSEELVEEQEVSEELVEEQEVSEELVEEQEVSEELVEEQEVSEVVVEEQEVSEELVEEQEVSEELVEEQEVSEELVEEQEVSEELVEEQEVSEEVVIQEVTVELKKEETSALDDLLLYLKTATENSTISTEECMKKLKLLFNSSKSAAPTADSVTSLVASNSCPTVSHSEPVKHIPGHYSGQPLMLTDADYVAISNSNEIQAILDKIHNRNLAEYAVQKPMYIIKDGQLPHPSIFLFDQPLFFEGDFSLRVFRDHIALEYCLYGQGDVFTGFVRVSNATAHERVFVRYTLDNWATYTDETAHLIRENYREERSDRFVFDLPYHNPGYTEFALCYQSKDGGVWWDNNREKNYKVGLNYDY